MIPFDLAFQIINQIEVPFPSSEKVDLTKALHRILADDIYIDMDLPPFDKSAMDGYACRKDDTSSVLQIVDTIAAGNFSQVTMDNGQCAKIMTGAPLPSGADCVIKVEDTRVLDNNRVEILKRETKKNVSFKGEDVKKGEKVLEKGIFIKPQHLAVLASCGIIKVPVFQTPNIVVFSTGTELVNPSAFPKFSQIRDSNSYQIISQLNNWGFNAMHGGIIADNEEITFSVLQETLNKNDIIFLSGGVSAGDFDFIPTIIKELGFEIIIRQIAIQPGKPTIFAKKGNQFIIGLPGNPVSSFVVNEILFKPFLFRLIQGKLNQIEIQLPLAENFNRKNAERLGFVPVEIHNNQIYFITYHGSGHLLSLKHADALVEIPLGVNSLKKGELVRVRLI